MSKREAFETLLQQELEAMYRTACRMIGDATAAEDLVQEAALRAFKGYHRFQPGTSFRAWIFRILSNAFINEYRHKARRPVVTDFADHEPESTEDSRVTPAHLIALKEKLGDEAARAVEQMPPTLRLVFFLSTFEGFSYKEIADVADVPIGTVMSRLFRAREMLRRHLAGAARRSGLVSGGQQP